MKCIHCSSDTSVENSRLQKRTNTRWRRRQCDQCKALFSTIEHLDLRQSIVVSKDSGALEPFWRQKLFLSIYDSLKHRKTAISDAESLCDTIIARLLAKQTKGLISARLITELCTLTLKRFDKVAATHYQAFHKS